MLKVFSMLCSAALLVTAPTPTFAGKILVVGDSYGGFAQCGPTGGVDGVSGGFIQEFCANQTVVNLAVSGSTAYQWGDGNTLNIQDKFTEAGTGVVCIEHLFCPGKSARLNSQRQRSFARVRHIKQTHVWYTIGGNDFMTPQEDPGAPGSSAGACEISKADLLARFRPMLTKALAARDATGNSGAKFIFTGYCLPKSPGPCPGGTFNKNVLTEVYQTLASENPNDVEYINIWDKCLGSGNAANSDPEFFADIIHLNKRGYCQVFTCTS